MAYVADALAAEELELTPAEVVRLELYEPHAVLRPRVARRARGPGDELLVHAASGATVWIALSPMTGRLVGA